MKIVSYVRHGRSLEEASGMGAGRCQIIGHLSTHPSAIIARATRHGIPNVVLRGTPNPGPSTARSPNLRALFFCRPLAASLLQNNTYPQGSRTAAHRGAMNSGEPSCTQQRHPHMLERWARGQSALQPCNPAANNMGERLRRTGNGPYPTMAGLFQRLLDVSPRQSRLRCAHSRRLAQVDEDRFLG
jgi:hypothetical protein